MKRFLILLGLIFGLTAGAHAQVATVTGSLKDLGINSANQQNTFVQFNLQNYQGIPRVVGTNAIVSPTVKFQPDINGNISGSIQQNNSITANAQTGFTFYRVCIYFQGTQFQCNNFIINSNFNLNTATPTNTSALPLPPSLVGLTVNLPHTCTVGQVYFATDAVAGLNLFYCTATNTWVQTPLGPSGPPGPTGATGPPGSSGNPASPGFSLQYANSGVTAFLGAAGITTPDGNSLNVKGPTPSANLRNFTRDAWSYNGCSTTATISLGSPTTATVASGACFQNGDGITIVGAGAAVSVSTPSAPTVTPAALSAGGTELGGGTSVVTVVAPANGGTKASTYQYIIVAFDKFGGFAAPSSATTITNGLAALGTFNCPISTESRSGRNVTVNFTSACQGAVVGAGMLITGTQPNPPLTFTGFYNIQTVNSSTQVVLAGPYNSNGFGWNSSDNNANLGTNSGTGGTAYFISSNHLSWTYGAGVWRYGICAKRPGDSSYNPIYITKPSSAVYRDIQADDYGSPFMDNQVFPRYFTNAVCNGVAGLADPLTTTVTAGGGTTTLTLNNAATTAVTGNPARFDNAPGIVVAANSVAAAGTYSELFIPPTGNPGSHAFIVESYLTLPAGIKIKQAGTLVANETVEVSGNILWDGSGSAQCSGGQFAYYVTGGACIYTIYSNPTTYISGDNVHMENLGFATTGNQNGPVFIVDDASHTSIHHVQFAPSGGTNVDFLSMAIDIRGDVSGGDSKYDIDHILYVSSTYSTQAATWTPWLFMANAQNGSGGLANPAAIVNLGHVSLSWRGIVQEGSGVTWHIENVNRQSGVMPFLWHENGNGLETITIKSSNIDTDGASIVSMGNNTGVPSGTPDIIQGVDVSAGAGLTFGGFGPVAYQILSQGQPVAPLPNATGVTIDCANSGTVNLDCNYDQTAYIGPNAEIFFPLPAPTNPTATAAAGGAISASITVQATVTAVGLDGKETISAVLSSGATTSGTCPGSGNCEINIAWTPPSASGVSYNVYACTTTIAPVCNVAGPSRQATGITGTTYTLTTCCSGGIPPPSFTQTGQSGQLATITYSPTFESPEEAAPSGLTNVGVWYEDSSTHLPTVNANAVGAQTLPRYTVSPTNLDCVDWIGITGLLGDPGGKCARYTITPTNGDCVTWSGVGGLLGDAGAACGAGGGGMNTNMSNMATPTAMNTGLTCTAANTCFVGTQPIPMTNVCIGTVANQAGCFDTTAVTGNVNIKFPNAASTAVQNCPSVANQFLTQILQSNGACTTAQPTLANIAAGAVPTGLFDFSAGTMKIPQAAGFTATVNSTIGLDTTAGAFHFWINAADSVNAAFAAAPGGTKCVQTSGTKGLLVEIGTVCGTTTPTSTESPTNKNNDAEATGNTLSEPIRPFFQAGGCNNTTAGNSFDIGTTNLPTPVCSGSTVRKGVLQFARGNVAYLNFHLPNDWNSGRSTDINLCFTTTDTTNGHVTSFNIQTGFNKVDGTATDDPALNASQALSFTTGASQVSGGEICASLTGMTMTGSNPNYNFEVAITRNNSGTDTNTDTAVAVKSAELVMGVSKNAANR
jgi:hypothetical protein